MSEQQKTKHGHLHGEAFALMWYACEKCGHRERIWNSRDGVTPFGIRCTSCGESALHADWHLDEYAPNHKPLDGQRFFRDGTPDEAEEIMRKRCHKMRNTPYHPTPLKIEHLVKAARKGEMSEFQPGWPSISIAS